MSRKVIGVVPILLYRGYSYKSALILAKKLLSSSSSSSSSQAVDWKKRMGDPKPSVYKDVPLPEACLTSYQRVYVCHVTSPGQFYVQLIGTDTTQALEGLQQDMTSFYTSVQGQLYSVEDVYPGLVSSMLYRLLVLKCNSTVESQLSEHVGTKGCLDKRNVRITGHINEGVWSGNHSGWHVLLLDIWCSNN